MYPWLTRVRLRLVGEVTDERLHELMQFPNFASCFEIVRIEPLSGQQMREIVDQEAARIGLPLPRDSRERLFELSESFSAASAGPGPALDLVRKLRDYREQKVAAGEPAAPTPLFAEKVFAIHSGLPLFVVSRTETKSAGDIRRWFRERLIGQEAAIDAVVEMIASTRRACMTRASRSAHSCSSVRPESERQSSLAASRSSFSAATGGCCVSICRNSPTITRSNG
jgi:ATP-dependent Clp protease ATP-binding subunit ClpC